MLKELYDLNTTNKQVLAQKFDSETTEDMMAPAVQREIERALNPKRGFPTFKTGPARKALRDYIKVVPPYAAVDMELYYMQQGIEATNTYGDIDEPFYNSLISVWESVLARIAKGRDPEAYLPRLRHMVAATSGIGWGFHDELSYLLETFETKVEA